MRPEAASELPRVLGDSVARFGCGFAVEDMDSRDWASVTFTGARHRLRFRIEGARAAEAADRFVRRLDCEEFPLRGHVVAAVALLSDEREAGAARLAIEALTVEDA